MPALDIIAVRQPNGTIKSSPFYIRFDTRTSHRRLVQVLVNGKQVQLDTQQLVVEPYDQYVRIHSFHKMTLSSDAMVPGASFRLDPIKVSVWKKMWTGNLPAHKLDDMIPHSSFLDHLQLDEDVVEHRLDFTDGNEVVSARLFFYDWDEKFVITDVDATLPKSEKWGYLMAKMGKNHYTRDGIARLYHGAEQNGYRVIYMTSCPINRLTAIDTYLRGIRQQNIKMPSGPLLCNPNYLKYVMIRKMWNRRRDTFKRPFLQNLRSLFPSYTNPLVSGFGATSTDFAAYISAGINPFSCFRITPSGKVFVASSDEEVGDYLDNEEFIQNHFPMLDRCDS